MGFEWAKRNHKIWCKTESYERVKEPIRETSSKGSPSSDHQSRRLHLLHDYSKQVHMAVG